MWDSMKLIMYEHVTKGHEDLGTVIKAMKSLYLGIKKRREQLQ